MNGQGTPLSPSKQISNKIMPKVTEEPDSEQPPLTNGHHQEQEATAEIPAEPAPAQAAAPAMVTAAAE